MRRIILNSLILATTLALLATPLSAADAGSAKVAKDDHGIVLSNGDVVATFDGTKPLFHVRSTAAGDAAAPAFTFHADQLVEYRDLDGNGAPDDNEIVARLDLTEASAWKVNVSSSEGAADVNFTIDAPVKLQKTPQGLLDNLTSLPQGNAKVSLLFTVYDAAATTGILPLPSSAIQVKLSVQQWPFVNAAADRLALDARATGVATRALSGGVGSMTLAANGTSVGLVSWAATAKGKTDAGTAIDVPVKDAVQAEGNGTARLALTYDAPSLSTVQHDATVGLSTSAATQLVASGGVLGAVQGKTTPGAGAALTIGAAVAGVAALAAWRRR